MERNFIFQVDLLLKGHGNYACIYDIEFTMMTDLNRNNQAVVDFSCQNSVLSLIINIGTPSKTKCDEKVTGCAVIDLVEVSIKNVKKSVVRAEEFLCEVEILPEQRGKMYTCM